MYRRCEMNIAQEPFVMVPEWLLDVGLSASAVGVYCAKFPEADTTRKDACGEGNNSANHTQDHTHQCASNQKNQKNAEDAATAAVFQEQMERKFSLHGTTISKRLAVRRFFPHQKRKWGWPLFARFTKGDARIR